MFGEVDVGIDVPKLYDSLIGDVLIVTWRLVVGAMTGPSDGDAAVVGVVVVAGAAAFAVDIVEVESCDTGIGVVGIDVVVAVAH